MSRWAPSPHPEAHLWPSEVVTLGLLHALKGVGNRAFYCWLTRDYRALFPRLPERTRLFRLFTTHQDWTQSFLAAPTVLGVIDTYGIELIHTPCARAAARSRSAAKACRTTAGLSGGNSVWCSISGGWWSRGPVPPPMLRITVRCISSVIKEFECELSSPGVLTISCTRLAYPCQ